MIYRKIPDTDEPGFRFLCLYEKTERRKMDIDIEEMLKKPYMVMDILPYRVPENSEGQYAAVENYFRSLPQKEVITRKYTDIILKLNCYYDICVSYGYSEEWSDNPAPQEFADAVMNRKINSVRILIPSADMMIDIDRDDTYAVVFGEDEEVLKLLEKLAAAEGLFMWKP